MTTLEDVTKKRAEPSAEAAAAAELVRLAKEQGLSLTGPDGLLKQFTKTVLETALNGAGQKPMRCPLTPNEQSPFSTTTLEARLDPSRCLS